MRKLLVVGCFFLSLSAFAESDSSDVHFAAHFGLSYAITGGLYGVTNYGLHWEQGDALLFSGVTMGIVGAGRQILSAGNAPVNWSGFAEDVLGSAAFGVTSLIFNWKFQGP